MILPIEKELISKKKAINRIWLDLMALKNSKMVLTLLVEVVAFYIGSITIEVQRPDFKLILR